MDDALIKGVSDAFRLAGVPAVYTLAKGSEPIQTSVMVEYGEDLDDSEWRGALQASADVWVKESDIPAPEIGDKVSIGGVEWTVRRKKFHAGGMWRLGALRDLRPTFRR